MKKEYKELMEMVKVDEAMHERIVSHVHDYINQESRTVFSWLEMRKWATAVSVCLLIAVVGLGSQWLNSLKPTNDSGPIFGGNGIVEMESLDELTAQSGLPIQELHHLPFEVETVSYSLYWGELAQIVYEGAEQSCTLRLSLGSEDNSGDYTVYEQVKEVDAGEYTVTLKGNDELIGLALWQREGVSYSLHFDQGVSEQAVMEVIKELA